MLLTAQNWTEHGSCSALFFFFFQLLFHVIPKPPLGQIKIGRLNHITCDVYLSKAVETIMF